MSAVRIHRGVGVDQGFKLAVHSMLGLSPPLNIVEERAVLDGLECHMPSGIGEHYGCEAEVMLFLSS